MDLDLPLLYALYAADDLIFLLILDPGDRP